MVSSAVALPARDPRRRTRCPPRILAARALQSFDEITQPCEPLTRGRGVTLTSTRYDLAAFSRLVSLPCMVLSIACGGGEEPLPRPPSENPELDRTTFEVEWRQDAAVIEDIGA